MTISSVLILSISVNGIARGNINGLKEKVLQISKLE